MFARSDGQQVLGSDSNIAAQLPQGTAGGRAILDSDPNTCGFISSGPSGPPRLPELLGVALLPHGTRTVRRNRSFFCKELKCLLCRVGRTLDIPVHVYLQLCQ